MSISGHTATITIKLSLYDSDNDFKIAQQSDIFFSCRRTMDFFSLSKLWLVRPPIMSPLFLYIIVPDLISHEIDAATFLNTHGIYLHMKLVLLLWCDIHSTEAACPPSRT